MELLHGKVTEKIIGAAFEVYRVLGHGFLEKVYQRALSVKLESIGVRAETEKKIRVLYKAVEVGFYKADVFVDECVIVEIKVAKAYCPTDEAQLLNELKATGVQVGMLINFGRTQVEFKRLVY